MEKGCWENKKGCTCGLTNLPTRRNCHEASHSGTAPSAHLATQEQSTMMKLLVKLTKKVERVIVQMKNFRKGSKKTQIKKNDISRSKNGRRQYEESDEDEDEDEIHEESDEEFLTDD
ncbi:hypothetical protein CDL15_Pgr014440 [Punica granatum]|uniref:Uncharacterized protein n=1 Tax=Punica granatum TaxID=22663 RepID=A0A218WD17_PUNGR|nr:hypothetical protein CDL15_Pgr014440 [Punica granatum]PKI41705.1 hypothetical protein CRG98_037907 [Punica granatum]